MVPEAATNLIQSGVHPELVADFQKYIIEKQLQNEKFVLGVAKEYLGKGLRSVIILDRALMDGLAYTDDTYFKQLANTFGVKSTIQWLKRYDAVLALDVAPRECYTTENNMARSEDYKGAVLKGEAVKKAWHGANKLLVIENPEQGGFSEKMRRVVNTIFEILGEPPVELEYKWVVREVGVEKLETLNPAVFYIEQDYPKSENDVEERVRKICDSKSSSDIYLYYHTIKKPTEDSKKRSRIEIERKISAKEYEELLMRRDPESGTIRKTRYAFLYNGKHFELDVLLDNSLPVKYLLEVELPDSSVSADSIELPDFVKGAVLDNGQYSNAKLAKMVSKV